jgi:RNA polymerase sigma-70 factor (ECF subfamily)
MALSAISKLGLGKGSELRAGLAATLPVLRARALKLCRNEADAADLLHDTIVRALSFEDSYEPDTNLRAWLQQILFSVFITRCRKRGRERRAVERLTNDPCAWTRPEGEAVLPGLTRPVRAALDTLPAQFGAVVRLVDLEERSYKDAAFELNVPVGTVMSRLFRGRRLLAEALTLKPALLVDIPQAA